jgi:hypothetical protein
VEVRKSCMCTARSNAVTGALPIRGVLRHKGWHVKEVNLPPLPQGSGRMVIAPAEVENFIAAEAHLPHGDAHLLPQHD